MKTWPKSKVAVSCAKRGWLVFPLYSVDAQGRCTCGDASCSNPGKHPNAPHGFKDATLNRDQIDSWWDADPDANVGVCTGSASGLVVLDVDPRHGGEESLQRLESDHGRLPQGPRVATGGGGWHFYFLHPGGSAKIKSKTGILPGLDLRADGAYIVGPESSHASGCNYSWYDGKTPRDLAIPPFPKWLANLAEESSKPSPVDSTDFTIPEGARNSTLASLAGAMRRQGAGPVTIHAALVSENEQRCKPPLQAEEVHQIANSVSRYEPGAIHSALPRDGVRAVKSLRFQTAAEIASATPEQIDWIVRPWVAAGSITEIDAKVKAGKTTLVMDMIRAALDGLPFMGESTRKGPVVYLTEQPVSSFRQALERSGLLGRDDLSMLFWHDTIGMSWEAVAKAAIEECKRRNATLLVVDTIAQFARLYGDAENNAGTALLAMQPLQEAAAVGIGVIMIRHERKRGGEVGDSGRGSSAFAGAVDTIISIRRPEGNSRRAFREVHAVSRFSETPDELMIELTANGYVSHGSVEAVAIEEATHKIRAEVSTDPNQARNLDELVAATKVTRTSAQRAIETMMKDGRLCRDGKGKRGDPFRFLASREDSAQTPTPKGQNETGTEMPATNLSGADEIVSEKMRRAGELSQKLLPREANFPGAAGPGGDNAETRS